MPIMSFCIFITRSYAYKLNKVIEGDTQHPESHDYTKESHLMYLFVFEENTERYYSHSDYRYDLTWVHKFLFTQNPCW